MSDQPLPAFDQIPGMAPQYLADIHAQATGAPVTEQAVSVDPAGQVAALAPVTQLPLPEAQAVPTVAVPVTGPVPDQAPEKTHDLAEHRRHMREAADLGAEAVQAVQTAPLPADEIPSFLQ